MNGFREMIFKNEKRFCLCVSAFACALYFLFLLRFYLIDYQVPDFRLYGSMAVANRKAADGFSSLFIAAISRIAPKAITVLCLSLLSAGIFNLLFFYLNAFYKNFRRFIFVLLLTFSCGCWYYFYGKIFYDFPFSAFSYSLCLLQVGKIIAKNRNGESAEKNWLCFFVLAGFTLSWKPYNVFMLAGLLFLALAKTETRKILCAFFLNAKNIAASVATLVLGYCVGNFNLLVSPIETVRGIQTYPASFRFREFMYGKSRIIWDHVCDLPFNQTVFALSTLVLLFVLIPLLSGRKKYVPVFLAMMFLFRFYIKHFSPGYAWHGLVFGVFLLTAVLFVFSEKEPFPKSAKIISVVALCIQFFVTFGFYLPTQIRWHTETQKAIRVLEEQNGEILSDVENLISGFGSRKFFIDEPVKRYRPMRRNSIHPRKMGIRQPYIIFDDIWNSSPLEYPNQNDWERIYRLENCTQHMDKKENKYIVYVVPNCFKRLCDVSTVFQYENMSRAEIIRKNDYTIYVYDTGYQDPNDIDSVFENAADLNDAVVTE